MVVKNVVNEDNKKSDCYIRIKKYKCTCEYCNKHMFTKLRTGRIVPVRFLITKYRYHVLTPALAIKYDIMLEILIDLYNEHKIGVCFGLSKLELMEDLKLRFLNKVNEKAKECPDILNHVHEKMLKGTETNTTHIERIMELLCDYQLVKITILASSTSINYYKKYFVTKKFYKKYIEKEVNPLTKRENEYLSELESRYNPEVDEEIDSDSMGLIANEEVLNKSPTSGEGKQDDIYDDGDD